MKEIWGLNRLELQRPTPTVNSCPTPIPVQVSNSTSLGTVQSWLETPSWRLQKTNNHGKGNSMVMVWVKWEGGGSFFIALACILGLGIRLVYLFYKKTIFNCFGSRGGVSSLVGRLVTCLVDFPLIFKLGLTVHARSLLITTHEYLLQYATEYKTEK